MSMRFTTMVHLFVLVGFVSCAKAQNQRQDSTAIVPAAAPRPVLTGKERLGKKWTDEQRIDNCHVPIEKRGTKPRPGVCPNDLSS